MSMFGDFDFVKAGKVTSVVLKGGRKGLKKMAGQAYAKLKEYAEEEDLTSARAEGTKDTEQEKEGATNGTV